MRSNQYLKTALAVTLTLGAIAAPAASADDPDRQAAGLAPAATAQPAQTTSVVRPNPDQQTPASAPTTIVRVSSPTSGFDWADAGIGAAGGFALSMLALGLVLVVPQLRARRSHRSAATAS